ncbi:sigma-70 family RNA polymerase sigma factor [Paraflavisolibacter sp. H34]|uniref:sigma-70 family RNA polymerase sigma factor n=1 Tax=Huijunlia imazamoxiresistens TaxID=3127457 RepID=UPI00301B13E9
MEHNHLINSTDRQLVNRVLAGDKAAFGLLIRNTERLVAQIVTRMIPNPEDRKDKAQDIYLKAYKSLPSFQFDAKLSTWIARISYNACLDELRKKKLVFPDNLPGGEEDYGQLPPDDSVFAGGRSADDLLLRKDLSGILQAAMEQLPPVYKTLVALYHQEEMSYEEIGNITGLPGGTVKSYLFRARKALKNYLLRHYKKADLW